MFVSPFVKKFNIVINDHGLTLVPRLIRICEIMEMFNFFRFWARIPLLGKFGTYINLNMQNSMTMLTFSVFHRKLSFLGEFDKKNRNCQFWLKLGTWADSDRQNLMVLFVFRFWLGIPFLGNLVQQIKIVSSCWNLVSRLIGMWRIQWWRSLFSVLDQKYRNTVLGQIRSQNSKLFV